jgi:hypothetical protein
MNNVLKIESILGYVANDNHLRASRDGKEFEGILPAPSWTEELVKRDGIVTDTVSEMKKVIRKHAWQTSKLAPLLKGKDLYETCHNIWNFLFTHIKYKEDDEGKEQLRTPALSWAVRRNRGIDCDDFTLFAGCLLFNLKIPFYIRIARYEGKNFFQHVYPLVPLKDKQYITIDAVLDEYDTEKQPIETKDFLLMDTTNLNGIDISVLGGIEDDTLKEISGILSGEDFKEVNQMEGLGTIASREDELNAIQNHLIRTRNIIARNPELIHDTEHPESFLGRIDYALKYWDTDKRDEALGILSGEEEQINAMEGLSATDEAHEDVELFYGLNGLGAYDVLGKAKRQRKFFAKVKQAVKKAGQGIKKVAKKLVRFNPLTVTIRAAVLLALKVNLLKVSSKLKWGYLTEQEAIAHGFDLAEWRKLKEQLAQAEKMFVNTLQGKAENFKRAILTGRAGKLSGTDLGLGVVVAAATAASTTAAVPFITKILNLLKKINFGKLVSKVKISKLAKKKKKAEQSDQPTADGESAIPESEGTDTTSENTSSDANESTSESTTDSSGNEGAASTEEGNDSTENLPATNEMRAFANPVEENILTKAITWVKENKTTSIMIAAGAAFLIYNAVKPARKPALSGIRKRKGKGKARHKKGKAKNHPPHTVSGTHKRRIKKIKL